MQAAEIADLPAEAGKQGVRCVQQQLAQLGERWQAVSQYAHLARVGAAEAHAVDDALDVLDPADQFAQLRGGVLGVDKCFQRTVAGGYRLRIGEGLEQPAPELAATAGVAAAVEQAYEPGAAAGARLGQQFEVTDGARVEVQHAGKRGEPRVQPHGTRS